GSEEPRRPLALTRCRTCRVASTALTVTLWRVPAAWALGVPVLPDAVPGAGVSPGTNNCNFTNPPALTGMGELVAAVLAPSVMSLAVTVRVPAALRVTLKLPVPPTRVALGGRLAPASDEVIPTVSATFVIRCQLASTALTVTAKAVPAV